jgi:hypothetical protein
MAERKRVILRALADPVSGIAFLIIIKKNLMPEYHGNGFYREGNFSDGELNSTNAISSRVRR